MLPYITIAACAVVGFVLFGWSGAIGGLIVGYVLSMAIGLLVSRIRGGFVPRSECRRVAVKFMRLKGELARAAFGGATDAATAEAVEEQIQRIFNVSVESAPPMAGAEVALAREAIRTVALNLAEGEFASSPVRAEGIYQLLLQIQLDMYNHDEAAAGPPYIHDPLLTPFERRRLLAKPSDFFSP